MAKQDVPANDSKQESCGKFAIHWTEVHPLRSKNDSARLNNARPSEQRQHVPPLRPTPISPQAPRAHRIISAGITTRAACLPPRLSWIISEAWNRDRDDWIHRLQCLSLSLSLCRAAAGTFLGQPAAESVGHEFGDAPAADRFSFSPITHLSSRLHLLRCLFISGLPRVIAFQPMRLHSLSRARFSLFVSPANK